MVISTRTSLDMLMRCVLYAEVRETEVSFFEPDDAIDQYIDFLEKINPCDWLNDMYLLELIECVFNRKEDEEHDML